MEWNDCEKCKCFEECYHYPIDTARMTDDMLAVIRGLRMRDLCVNNGKKMFKGKDAKD